MTFAKEKISTVNFSLEWNPKFIRERSKGEMAVDERTMATNQPPSNLPLADSDDDDQEEAEPRLCSSCHCRPTKNGYPRCWPCQKKLMANQPKRECIGCHEQIPDKGYPRCWPCQEKYSARQPKRKCIGCGKLFPDKGYLRCWECHSASVTATPKSE